MSRTAPAITNTTTTAEKARAARTSWAFRSMVTMGLEKDKRGGPKRGRRKTDR
jgi:hypothetical protein